jgi:hypothetical protein
MSGWRAESSSTHSSTRCGGNERQQVFFDSFPSRCHYFGDLARRSSAPCSYHLQDLSLGSFQSKSVGGMTPFQKHVGVPAVAAVTTSALVMALDDRFGPAPKVLPFRYGAVIVHIPRLLGLFLIGAAATFLARRIGASLTQQVIVALSPALVIGGAVNLLMAIVVTAAHHSGHRVHAVDFIGHFIVGWLALPTASLLIGSLPFLLGQAGKKVAGVKDVRRQISG